MELIIHWFVENFVNKGFYLNSFETDFSNIFVPIDKKIILNVNNNIW